MLKDLKSIEQEPLNRIKTILILFCVMALGIPFILTGLFPERANAAGEVTEIKSYLTPEQVQKPAAVTDPSGRVTFELKLTSDGTGHGTNTQSPIRESNGFLIGDETPLDGVVSIGDRNHYSISYNVQPSSTPTTFFLSVGTRIENREGDLLDMGNAWDMFGVADTVDFTRFCQGGAGYSHIGKFESRAAADGLVRTGCLMTFPPSVSSTTTKSQELKGNPITNRFTDGFFNIFIDAGSGVSYIPHRTRIVGTTSIEAILYNREPVQVFESGEGFYEYNVDLKFTGAFRKKGVVDFTSAESKHNPQFQTNGRIAVNSLPEGSKISTNGNGLSVDGTDIVVNTIAKATSQHHLISGVDQGDSLKRIIIRVPMSSIPEGGEIHIDTHIESLEMKRIPVSPRDRDWLHPNFVNFNQEQRGNGEASDFNTALHSVPGFNGAYLAPSGIFGFPNNDWARMTLRAPNYGVWFKDIVSATSETPSFENDKLVESSSVGVRSVKYGDPYWTTVGITGWPGTMSNATYCDVWDPTQQKVDTSREPHAFVWNGSEYENAHFTIEYASTGRGANLVGSEAGKHQGQTRDCFTDDSIEWNSAPTEDTDVFRVVFEDQHSAAFSPDVDMYRDGVVHIAYVPFIFASITEDGGLSNLPRPTAIRNTVIHSNSGNVRPERDTAQVWTYLTHMDPSVPANSSFNQNSGTTASLPLPNIRSGGQVLPGETITENFVIRTTIDSAYSSITFSEEGGTKLRFIEPADFGPDGLPGTEDDISDWVVEFEVSRTFSSAGQIVVSNERLFTGTIPAHIEGGRALDYTIEIMNPEDFEGDDPTNNRGTGKIYVHAASTIAQSKWALTPREMTGDRVGWGISWANTSTSSSRKATMVDILPHNGDGRGTEISTPLSDIQIDPRTVDSDVLVEVTDHDPTQINDDSISNGAIRFVPLAEQDSLEGEVTAFRITENSIEQNSVRYLEVTASTEGSEDGDVVRNNLEPGVIEGMALEMPSTLNVETVLVSTGITGNAFFDSDKDGTLDDDESVRYSGIEVELLDSNGDVLRRTVTNESGNYEFLDVPFGDYTVRTSSIENTDVSEYERTTSESISVRISGFTPKVNNVDFGFWVDSNPSISVVKSVVGFEEGSAVPYGTEVTFNFVVSNTGDSTIENIALSDDVLGDIVCPDTELAPGEEMTCSVTSEMKPTKIDDQIARSEGGKSPNGGYYHPGASLSGYNSESRNYYTGRQLCQTDFCPAGQRIVDLGFTADGKLIGGHGDWTSNIDSFGPPESRPSIREFDPISKTWSDPVFTGSEANDRIIEGLDGSVFIPQTDPSDKPGTDQTRNNISGYWTNENGRWELVQNATDQIHVFDVWRAPDGTTYTAGSEGANSGSAVVWKASPGSRTFERVFQHSDGSGWSRAYWLEGDKDGNVYFGIQSKGAAGTWKLGAGKTEPEKILDSNRSTSSRQVESFNGGVIIGGGQGWWSSDGHPESGYLIQDLYVDRTGDTDVLYSLNSDNIVRKFNGSKWVEVMAAPKDAISLAYRDGILYFGSTGGEILIRSVEEFGGDLPEPPISDQI